MKCKKMWKELASLAMAILMILGIAIVPAAARGPVKDPNAGLVVKTSWGYSAPKKGARKIRKFKPGTLVKVKMRCRTATFKTKKGKIYKGYIDEEPAYGVYGLSLRKSPNPKSKVLIKKMKKKDGRAKVTGWWQQVSYKRKNYWLVDEYNIDDAFNPFEDGKYFFFVRECGGDNTGTAGSGFRYWIRDYWRDEYSVSPWGYTLLKRAK